MESTRERQRERMAKLQKEEYEEKESVWQKKLENRRRQLRKTGDGPREAKNETEKSAESMAGMEEGGLREWNRDE